MILILLTFLLLPINAYADGNATIEAGVIEIMTCNILECNTPIDTPQPEKIVLIDGTIMYIY